MNVIWSGEGEATVEVRILDPLHKQLADKNGSARAIHQGRESSLTFRDFTFVIETEGTYSFEWRLVGGSWQHMKLLPVVLART